MLLLKDRQWNEIPFEASSNHKLSEFFQKGGGPPSSVHVRNNISGGTTTYYRTENGNHIKLVKRGPRSAGLM